MGCAPQPTARGDWIAGPAGGYTDAVPELPEVETVARLLRPDVVGRTITGARVGWRPTVGGSTGFAKSVVGRRIAVLWRRAKYLVFELEHKAVPDGCLVAHLRMTGRMHVEPADLDAGPWCRVALALDDGRELRFVDPRKFGRVLRARVPADVFGDLGPEPLEDGFDPDGFFAALAERRRHLKPLLLDQTFVAGLGNIYVDESLFQARLHPLTPSDRVPRAKAVTLHGAIRSTLRAAIEREGSSFDTFYRTPGGQPGSYQDQFLVYGRQGKPCPRCGGAIRRMVVGQRGTHLCPRCQPKPRSRA